MPRRSSPTGRDRAESKTSVAGSVQNPTPESLVARCLAHDDDAWTEFVRRYANLIYATILRVQLPEEDVEEAFQASIVAIHQQLAKLREPERLVSWIVGIAHRQAINRIRARGRDLTVVELDPEAHVAENELPDEERHRLLQVQQVREALENLPDRCRHLLHSLFFEDPAPDYETISRRAGIPIGSIGPTRARCLDKLRAGLGDAGWLP